MNRFICCLCFLVVTSCSPEWPFYSGEKGIESALQQFLGESTIKLLGGKAGSGLSGNAVYRVTLQNGQSFIVKVFAEETNDFSKELLALTTYNNLNLKELHIPKVYKVGRTHIDHQNYFFIAEEDAQEQVVMDLLISMLKSSPSERSIKMEKLSQIFHLLGRGLAELHTAGNPITHEMHPSYYESFMIKAIDGKNEYIAKDPSHKESAEEIFDRFKFLMDHRGAKPYGFTHEDPHFGNYIWNDDLQKIVMIDLTDSARSIGPNGEPIGNPMIDVSRILISLSAWQMWGLLPEEKELLEQNFLAGYQELNPDLEELELFNLINAYSFFSWFPKKENTLSNDTRERFLSVWNHYESVMKESLCKGKIRN